MEQITVKEILEATGGRLLCGDATTSLWHISIDSRTMKGKDLFVPLSGEKVDAHQFIDKAFVQGAAAVLTSEHDVMDSDKPYIRVLDTRKALQAVGAYYRNRLTIPLVGITGSVGKTTTREMVAAALSAGLQVFKTPGNYNSQVGVPITLTEISEKDEIGVIELGMSEPGELTVIAKIARIHMAVITNIGVTHIEQLGSQENIYQEKLTIQDGLEDGGILFLNGDDEMLKITTARPGFRTVYYGTGENCEYRAVDIRIEDGCASFTAAYGGERVRVRLTVMGRHNVLNAMVSLAIAKECGISMEKAAIRLESFTGFQNRQQVYESGKVTIIDDTYNASPVSMKAGLDVLASLKKEGRKIAVLADMKELGRDGPRFHYEIGTYIAGLAIDEVVGLGELSSEICRGIQDSKGDMKHTCFTDRDALSAYLDGLQKPGDCILFKGSNSMRLGEIAARFI